MTRTDTLFYIAAVALASACAVLVFEWTQRMLR